MHYRNHPLLRLGTLCRTGAAAWRRACCILAIVVQVTLLDRDGFQALKLVLVFFAVVEADDTALLTDPIEHLAGCKNIVLPAFTFMTVSFTSLSPRLVTVTA